MIVRKNSYDWHGAALRYIKPEIAFTGGCWP
jgi:hypothetical protein